MVTGLNRAFIIDSETKEALIREDPRSAELLKPVVRGRDVHAYRVDWAGLWLVDTHNGYGSAPAVNLAAYPAVQRHLDAFMPALKNRQDKGETPYNLRSCAYYEKFRQPKIMWGELANDGRFAVDRLGMYCNNTVFLMTADTIHWLCAVLNSPVARRWTAWTARTSGMGVTRWEKGYVGSLPVPRRPGLEPTCQALIEGRNSENPDADGRLGGAPLQAELNLLVGTEYGLTEAESRLLLRLVELE